MALDKILITNINKITPKHVADHQPYEYDKYEIVTSVQRNQTVVAFYTLLPGKSNYPYHYHMTREEVFYIISGQGTLETPEGEVAVAPGDVIFFPIGETAAHKLTNTSSEPLVYLDVDGNHSPDVVVYPHTNKINVYTNEGFKKLFNMGDHVGYYEGE